MIVERILSSQIYCKGEPFILSRMCSVLRADRAEVEDGLNQLLEAGRLSRCHKTGRWQPLRPHWIHSGRLAGESVARCPR